MQISDTVSACYWLTLTSLLSPDVVMFTRPGHWTNWAEELSWELASLWPGMQPHNTEERERGHNPVCQLKLQSFQLWADFNNNSQHLSALNLLGLVINDSIWPLIDKNLLVWTLRLNKNKIGLDLCSALTWVSWVRVMRLIITVVSVTVRSLWNIKGPCCPYRETRKYFLYLWTIWVFRLAALVSLRGREEISLTCLEMLQMPAKTQHNKLAMF